MKTVAIIPIKENSKRVKKKNFKKINKVPLYEILLKKLKKCDFDEVYIDSDSGVIRKFCIKNNFKFIKRLPRLTLDNANGNDLLNYHSKIIKADFYFQLFITAPLMSVETINKCIKFLKNSRKYDSILTSRSIYSWFWFNKKPINYKPNILPRSQDAKPVIVETTGLYGISSQSLQKYKCRIGKNPFFFEVPANESLDLDNEEDFKHLKFLLRK